MLKDWFAKEEQLAKQEQAKTFVPGITDAAGRSESRLSPPASPPTLEQIYQTATVKPTKNGYGIQKLADMANSAHLSGMPPEFRRKALLMALDASATNVAEVLNDWAVRQRALKEYEDSFLDKVNRFEEAMFEKNRREQAELDKLVSQCNARIQANLDAVDRCRAELHAWQENKQKELQRFSEVASLCVLQDKANGKQREPSSEEEVFGNLKMMVQATGTSR